MSDDDFPEDEAQFGDWASSQPVIVPKMVDPFPLEADYVPQSVLSIQAGQVGDYTDVKAINEAIDRVRIAIFRTSEHLRQAEAKETQARIEYERRFNRAYLSTNARTEGIRRAMASMKAESYENRVIVRSQIVKELVRRTRVMANELDALKTLAYNARREMDVSR